MFEVCFHLPHRLCPVLRPQEGPWVQVGLVPELALLLG